MGQRGGAAIGDMLVDQGPEAACLDDEQRIRNLADARAARWREDLPHSTQQRDRLGNMLENLAAADQIRLLLRRSIEIGAEDAESAVAHLYCRRIRSARIVSGSLNATDLAKTLEKLAVPATDLDHLLAAQLVGICKPPRHFRRVGAKAWREIEGVFVAVPVFDLGWLEGGVLDVSACPARDQRYPPARHRRSRGCARHQEPAGYWNLRELENRLERGAAAHDAAQTQMRHKAGLPPRRRAQCSMGDYKSARAPPCLPLPSLGSSLDAPLFALPLTGILADRPLRWCQPSFPGVPWVRPTTAAGCLAGRPP